MNKKILIIDDDTSILEVMKIILEENGYDVIITTTGENIEQKIQQNSPNMILLDFWLNGMNGQQVVKHLKARQDTKNIPIIMVSANHEPKKTAEEIGVSDFLAKPFNIEDLINVVQKYTIQ